MIDAPSRPLPRPFLVALALLASVAALLCFGVTGALAVGGSAEINIARTNASPQNSGAPTQYSINFSCSGVAATTCGEEPLIRIPLVLTPPLEAGTPPMETWNYGVSSGIAGLVAEQVIEGNELVLRLDPTKLIPGESDTIQLAVTPPNGITPNGTTWSLTPTFETEEIEPVLAKTTATGEAVATAMLAVSKKTLDEGAVYVRGHQVIFNITAQCSPGATTGKLFMTEGSLTDLLPEGLEYVSATPAPAKVVPGAGGPTEIIWSYENGAALPPGCGQGSTGSGTYQVTANVPSVGPNAQAVENKVTFAGLPIDQKQKETSAGVPLTLVNEAPSSGELGTSFLSKTSQAPLCVEGAESLPGRSDCYAGTYPGHWINPGSAAPAFTPGSAEGRFEVRIRYPASRAYETALVDPMPCLTGSAGPGYPSLPVTAPVVPGGAPLCAEPAFHPTVVWVAAPSLAAATTEGWVPTAILTDGEEVALTKGANGNGGTYFAVPAGDITTVAAIELPPNENLTDNQLRMTIFGYGDTTLEGGDVLENTATATAYPIGSATPANTSADSADIFIEPNDIQLGIKKSFGGLSNGPGGTTQRSTMTLIGSLTIPAGKTLPGPALLADLLPEGMTWQNPVGSANFTVTEGISGASHVVTATITREANYKELGRELIRVSIPKSVFENAEVGGFFTIKGPGGLFVMQVPNETRTFDNRAQIFVSGIGRETQPVCGGGEGTGEAEFQSADELDLAGTGEREQNYCESESPLAVSATGGPNFSLKKFVQGDLDASRKAALGIGKATRGGTGVFSLVWTNNGSAPLANPVVYDILPYVGDTGVDQGQSGNPRGSEFATEFVEMVTPLPAGVGVEYSTSTNPCRDEVNPGATPTCVEDWSTTVPATPATVKALRFTDPGTYLPGASFEVGVKVALPNGEVNDVAWNSAAADAETTGGVALAPAEPPKVGIEAEAPLVSPTLGTAASEASILPERKVSDAVTVGGTTGLNGTVKWRLLGPVVPVAGSCTGLAWGGAAVADQGSFAIAGDGTHSTAETLLTAHGCYAYETTVEGPGFEAVTSAAGTAGELVLVHPAMPELLTAVSAASVLPETPITDSVEITGTKEFEGTVKWTLFGPIAPGAEASCEGLEWAGAPVFDEGEFPIAEDGTGTTAPSVPAAHGCYGYEATIEGTHLETFISPVGSPGEMVLVHPATPTLGTSASAASVLPDASVTDAITIGATEGFEGAVSWRLRGPIPAAADGTCAGLDWTGAGVVAEGELEVAADGTLTTAATELEVEGCYGFQETLTGVHLTTTFSPIGAAGETVLVHPSTPTLATTAAPGSADPEAEASDQITVGGTSGFGGTVSWQLVGPVAANGESCAAANWAGAPVVAKGSLPVKGDETLKTPGTSLSNPGCYGYQETVEGTHLAKASTSVGAAGETVLIKAPLIVSPPPPAPLAHLVIEKRVDQSAVAVGTPLHYTIEVHNKGKGAATNVVVTDTPQSPLAFVSADPSAGTCGHAFPLVCKIGTLKAGASATVEVVATPTAGGSVVNAAKVTSPSDPATHSAHGVKAAAASRALVPLKLAKTVTPRTVIAGGRLHYTLAIANPTAAAARAFHVCDRLPAGLQFVSSSVKATLKNGSYCWRLAGMKAHATAKIAVVARVLAGAGGRLVNTATLGGGDAMPAKAGAAVHVKPLPPREGGVTG